MATAAETEKILRDLYLISGLRISLHDTEFNETAAYPEGVSGFCELVQRNPKARMHCLFTDRDAFERVRHAGRSYLYKCRFGLYEAACPLYRNGMIAGYLMMGQALEEGTGDVALAEALPYVGDREELERRIASLPPVSAEKLRALADTVALCAERLTESASVGAPPPDLAAAVVGYINRNIGSRLTLQRLCDAFHCSKSTLTKLFRRSCGVSVNEYITARRIDIAKELLRYTELPVGRISDKCGFSDPLYFSRCFSSRVGLSPLQFRKNPVKH